MKITEVRFNWTLGQILTLCESISNGQEGNTGKIKSKLDGLNQYICHSKYTTRKNNRLYISSSPKFCQKSFTSGNPKYR